MITYLTSSGLINTFDIWSKMAYQRARNYERQKYRRRNGGVSLWTGSSRSDIPKSGTRTCGMVPWSGTCKEGGTPRARQLAADGQKLAEPAATMREKEREIKEKYKNCLLFITHM
ncbi:hypothetical protein V1478_012627 [Vespula squamosa]|uniref:Uncharacterized protein n=1 Tax=Vespula squamosa TaxID=30214 RepID=A0ABD2A8G6_VESSQ